MTDFYQISSGYLRNHNSPLRSQNDHYYTLTIASTLRLRRSFYHFRLISYFKIRTHRHHQNFIDLGRHRRALH